MEPCLELIDWESNEFCIERWINAFARSAPDGQQRDNNARLPSASQLGIPVQRLMWAYEKVGLSNFHTYSISLLNEQSHPAIAGSADGYELNGLYTKATAELVERLAYSYSKSNWNSLRGFNFFKNHFNCSSGHIPLRPPLTTSGFSVHRDPLEAITRGVCELFERDAFLASWYREMPADFEILLPPDDLGSILVKNIKALGFRVKILEFPSIIPNVPTVAAVAWPTDNEHPGLCLGLSASLNVLSSSRKAILEMARFVGLFLLNENINRPTEFTDDPLSHFWSYALDWNLSDRWQYLTQDREMKHYSTNDTTEQKVNWPEILRDLECSITPIPIPKLYADYLFACAVDSPLVQRLQFGKFDPCVLNLDRLSKAKGISDLNEPLYRHCEHPIP